MDKFILFWVIIAALAVGSQELVLKKAMFYYSPIELTLFRFFIAGLIMVIIGRVGNRNRLQKRQMLLFSINGLILICLSMFLYQISLKEIKPEVTAVIFSCNIVFVVLFNFLILKIKISQKSLLGIIITIIGMIITINILNMNNWVGVILAILSSAIFALYSIIAINIEHKNIGVLKATGYTFLLGTILSLILMIILNFIFCNNNINVTIFTIPRIDLMGVIWLMISSLFNTSCAFLLYFYIIKHTNVIIGSIPFMIKPILAPILAGLISLQMPYIHVFIGGIIVLIGAKIMIAD